jgi:hypothetical protein
MRQRLAWLSTVPLMVTGLLAGHGLGYRLAIPDAHARADALAHSGHGYLGYTPLALTVCSGLLLVALAFRAVAGFRGTPSRPTASPALVLLPPLAFAVQEYLERLIHSGQVSWTVALQPSFLLGLALQLPFALAALLIAWALESVANAVGQALAATPPRPQVRLLFPVPALVPAVPRPAGLARGYGERAPPLLRRP